MNRTAVLIIDSGDVDRFRLEVAEGNMPRLAEFLGEAAFSRTKNVVSHRSEMAWAQFLSGKRASDMGWFGWWDFRPDRYETIGTGAALVEPFYARDPVETVIADVIQAHARSEVPGSQMFAYGSHSPQFPRSSIPAGMITEALSELGECRVFGNDHALGWFDERYVNALGEHGAEDLAKRSEFNSWMVSRTPNWQFLLASISEYHAVSHHIWHGVDENHILRDVSTAPAARTAHSRVIAAVDENVGRFIELADDATIVVGAHHGFQSADDLVNCVLLPELMFRRAFGGSALRDPDQASWKSSGMPPIVLESSVEWGSALRTQFRPSLRDVPRALFSALPADVYERLRRARGRPPHTKRWELLPHNLPELDLADESVWQRSEDLGREVPHWYRRFWPEMDAFAIPSFDDGRIRVNLAGRERDGTVPLARYEQVLADVESFVRQIVDARTNAPLVREVIFDKLADPMSTGGPDADIIVRWDRSTDAIIHPDFGMIGPYPFMRTASHREEGWFAVRGSDATAGETADVLSPFQFSALVDHLRRGASYSNGLDQITRNGFG